MNFGSSREGPVRPSCLRPRKDNDKESSLFLPAFMHDCGRPGREVDLEVVARSLAPEELF